MERLIHKHAVHNDPYDQFKTGFCEDTLGPHDTETQWEHEVSCVNRDEPYHVGNHNAINEDTPYRKKTVIKESDCCVNYTEVIYTFGDINKSIPDLRWFGKLHNEAYTS